MLAWVLFVERNRKDTPIEIESAIRDLDILRLVTLAELLNLYSLRELVEEYRRPSVGTDDKKRFAVEESAIRYDTIRRVTRLNRIYIYIYFVPFFPSPHIHISACAHFASNTGARVSSRGGRRRGTNGRRKSRRIECIFGNKYNLNELAVNWKWAIQGYLTRGPPLASPTPSSCSLSLEPGRCFFFFFRHRLPPTLSLSLFFPLSRCVRVPLFPPPSRRVSTLPLSLAQPRRRSKRYFRRQIPPQQRETSYLECFSLPGYFSPLRPR